MQYMAELLKGCSMTLVAEYLGQGSRAKEEEDPRYVHLVKHG